MEPSPEQTTYWVTNQGSTDTKRLRLFPAYSQITMLWRSITRKGLEGTWKLKTTLLKNAWINQEIKEELKQFMETNENEDTLVQNLWDTAKAVLRGKYIAIQASLRKI